AGGAASILSLVVFGGFVSALCFFIAGGMAWSRSFRERRAQGKPTVGNKARLLLGGLMTALAVIMLPKGADTASESKARASAEAAAAMQCDFGSHKTEADFAANSDVELRSAPKANAATVPWKVGDETVPFPMEEGHTVREHCRVGDWSKIHTPTSSDVPRLYGWVPSSSLRKVKTAADGRRVYTEADFDWPEGSAGLRAAAVKVMNRIMEQRRECEALDHQSLVLNKTTKGKVFSVPCFTAGEMLSFDFVAADATNGRSFAKVAPMEETDAVVACRSAVLSNATHPSTVDFPLGYDFRAGGEGRTQVLMSATAKNAFNLELKFKVHCDFNGTELTDFGMSEAQ
ncbi:hypothetical protein, partial [Sphingobium sp.]|uniref:hypothetical protein n=1 Tax=Sphingobium sp. TaxID=1912891 RepID=UPI0028BF0296